jgi:hypothetical protein
MSLPPLSHALCVQASLGFSMSAWPVTVAAALLKHWLLRASWDSVADGNGLLLLSDNVHLSDRGADIIAAEVGAVHVTTQMRLITSGSAICLRSNRTEPVSTACAPTAHVDSAGAGLPGPDSYPRQAERLRWRRWTLSWALH